MGAAGEMGGDWLRELRAGRDVVRAIISPVRRKRNEVGYQQQPVSGRQERQRSPYTYVLRAPIHLCAARSSAPLE